MHGAEHHGPPRARRRARPELRQKKFGTLSPGGPRTSSGRVRIGARRTPRMVTPGTRRED